MKCQKKNFIKLFLSIIHKGNDILMIDSENNIIKIKLNKSFEYCNNVKKWCNK